MPQRFLRPGITTSERWNDASWFEQSFYVRILTLVDDAGRYDARIDVLTAYCFPLRTDVKRQQTAAARSRLCELGLIEVYCVDDKEYLQVSRWSERVRNKSKWPDPQPSAAIGSQKTLPSPSPSFLVPETASAVFRERFEKWMVARKGKGKKPSDWGEMFREQFEWLQQFPEADRIEMLSQSIRNGWQGLFEVKGTNGTHQRIPAKGSRTTGTANERRTGQYDGVGQV